MITERLQLLSDELQTELSFSIDNDGEMVDLTISETKDGVPVPRFAILVDDLNPKEKYVLSVLENPATLLFGSSIGETIKVFVSPNIEEIFETMKKEVINDNFGD